MHRNVRSHSVLKTMADGANHQVHALKAAKRVFDVAEQLVAADRLVCIHRLGRDAASYNVDAVERGLGIDRLSVDLEAEGVVCNVKHKVLGYLVLVDDFAHSHTDRVLAMQLSLPNPLPDLVDLAGDRFDVPLKPSQLRFG